MATNNTNPDVKMSKKPSQLIWNGTERKVCIFVIEAMGLKAKKNESIEAYVKLSCRNTNFKTKTAHKTPDPYWGEFFFLTPSGADMSSSVTFSVWNNKIIDRCLGQFSIKLSDLDKERVYDMWCDLQPRSEKSKSNVSGKVHIRTYISFMKESAPEGRTNQFHQFLYEPYFPQFKTGDLIVFGGVGLISTLIKLYTNSEYSSLGIVVSLPNKYTEKEELHVVEVTRNIDGLFDPYGDVPKMGVSIFRLTERIHQFHGNGIWWCPITPLTPQEEAHLKSKMWALWTAVDPFESYKRSYPEVNNFLSQQFHVGKHVWDVCELYSPNVIASILRETGLDLNIGETVLTVLDIVNQEIFPQPIPIRVQKLQIPFSHSPTEPAWKTPTLSGADLNNGTTPLPDFQPELHSSVEMAHHHAYLAAASGSHPSQIMYMPPQFIPYPMAMPYPAFNTSNSRLRALIPEYDAATQHQHMYAPPSTLNSSSNGQSTDGAYYPPPSETDSSDTTPNPTPLPHIPTHADTSSRASHHPSGAATLPRPTPAPKFTPASLNISASAAVPATPAPSLNASVPPLAIPAASISSASKAKGQLPSPKFHTIAATAPATHPSQVQLASSGLNARPKPALPPKPANLPVFPPPNSDSNSSLNSELDSSIPISLPSEAGEATD